MINPPKCECGATTGCVVHDNRWRCTNCLTDEINLLRLLYRAVRHHCAGKPHGWKAVVMAVDAIKADDERKIVSPAPEGAKP